MGMGLNLRMLGDGSGRLTWMDVWDVLHNELNNPESALYRELNPDDYLWNTDRQLLALIADHLAFQRYEQHGKGKKPEQIPRPGVKGYKSINERLSQELGRNHEDANSAIKEGFIKPDSMNSVDLLSRLGLLDEWEEYYSQGGEQ